MKRYSWALIAVTLLACSSNPVRREDAIAAHPEWSADMVKLIRNGYLAKGMTQDMVKAAWGRPDNLAPGTTSGDWGESWQYATQIVFFDKQGKVIRWDKR